MRFLTFTFIVFLSTIIFFGCQTDDSPKPEDIKAMENEFIEFANELENRLSQAYTNYALATWDATISSNDENWAKVNETEIYMNSILTDRVSFEKLKSFKESDLIQDEILQRRLLILYNSALEKQADIELINQIVELNNAVQAKYSAYRAVVSGVEVTDNEIENILKTSTNNAKLKEAWLAHKQIGPLVADDILELVNMRNQVAKSIGFDNYHQMSLKLSQQDPNEIEKLFDELDNLTRSTYTELKNDIDEYLAKRYNISKDDLQAWHYQNRFFQEAPAIYTLDVDKFYQNQDLVKISETYFNSVGLPVDRIIANSDLFEKEGKNQHAYCINIDRDKEDIRIFCNIVPNARWMDTQLHELGHAVYEDYYLPELPWSLKSAAHTFTTEAIAMFFGRMATSPQWMYDMNLIDEDTKVEIADNASRVLTLSQIVFSRWAQVMYRFEKSLYENPEQDLNKLWWDLVEKYQMVKRPEGRDMPDWATKIHIASFPCYYHNYLMGELLASQLYYKIANDVLEVAEPTDLSFYNQPEVGAFLIKNVFNPGMKYYWNEMIEKATGEPLTAKYYAKQFMK